MKRVLLIVAAVAVLVLVGAALTVAVWGGVRALANRVDVASARLAGAEPAGAQRWGNMEDDSCSEVDELPGGVRGGQGRGQGQAAEAATVGSADCAEAKDGAQQWLTLRGTVIVGTDAGEDIEIRIESGETVVVGAGPQWLQSQGYSLETGETVTIHGYWEDGEFKAGEIIRERDEASIILRDETGRPAWSGAGRRAADQAAAGTRGNGSGQGNRRGGGLGDEH